MQSRVCAWLFVLLRRELRLPTTTLILFGVADWRGIARPLHPCQSHGCADGILKECHAAAKNASDLRPGGADIVKDAKDDLNKSMHHTQGAKKQAEADSGMEEQ